MASASTPLVLIVEDNPMMRRFYEMVFRGDNVRLLFADDGRAAWELTRKHLPNLIVTDINMPRMDGLGFAGLVKSAPGFDKIPLIAVTARQKDDPALKRAGFSEIISKPVTVDSMKQLINRYFCLSTALPMVTAASAMPTPLS